MASRYDALFDAVRDIPSFEAAARLNIRLYAHGDRSVARCPIHGEDTPSLTFYPDGRFFCFGCHEHGGAIELYQKVLNLPALEAARALAADFNIVEPARYTPAPRREPTAYDLKKVLDAFKGKRWGALCDIKHAANKRAAVISTMIGDHAICMEIASFWAAIKEASDVDMQLYQLETARPAELLAMAGDTDELI